MVTNGQKWFRWKRAKYAVTRYAKYAFFKVKSSFAYCGCGSSSGWNFFRFFSSLSSQGPLPTYFQVLAYQRPFLWLNSIEGFVPIMNDVRTLRWASYTKNGIFSYLSLSIHAPWKDITSPHFLGPLASLKHSLTRKFLCKTWKILFLGLIVTHSPVMTRFLTYLGQIMCKHQKIGYRCEDIFKGYHSGIISSS